MIKSFYDSIPHWVLQQCTRLLKLPVGYTNDEYSLLLNDPPWSLCSLLGIPQYTMNCSNNILLRSLLLDYEWAKVMLAW